MKSIIPLFLSLLASLACMGSLCDISSHNGGPLNPNPIDTTSIKHLDSIAMVSITFVVKKYDRNINKLVPLSGASVFIVNSGTNFITDSSGYVDAFFKTDSVPFQYSYVVTKTGFKKYKFNSWAENFTIRREVDLLEE